MTDQTPGVAADSDEDQTTADPSDGEDNSPPDGSMDQSQDQTPEEIAQETRDALLAEVMASHPSVASSIPADYEPDSSPLVNDPIPEPKSPKAKARFRHSKRGAMRRLMFGIKAMQALEYRIMGYSFQEIAGFCDYASAQAAHYAVTKAMEARGTEVAEDALRLDMGRLDKLYAAISTLAHKGDLLSVSTAQSIINQRQKLLRLDKPTKVAITDSEGATVAPDAWSATMAAAMALVNAAQGSKDILPVTALPPLPSDPAEPAEPANPEAE